MTPRDPNQEAVSFTRRGLILGLGQAALFGALASRLYQIQLLEAASIAARADDNRTRLIPLAPLRGRILDASGRVLASNRETFRAVLHPQRMMTALERQRMLERLAALIGLSPAQRDALVIKARHVRREPQVVAEGLTFEQLAALEVNRPELPGLIVEAGWTRAYPMETPREAQAMAHLVGYVGAVDRHAMDDDPILRLADVRIGKAGVEAGMDRDLRGVAGSAVVEVDARGRQVRRLEEKRALPGHDVTLTIDVALQTEVMARLGREAASGAVVALDIKTGHVVVMASTPTFDPASLTGAGSRAAWQALTADKDRPLVNRCIAGQYPPGSTFKMVTALAALEASVLTTKEKIECWGDVTYSGHLFRCWNRKGHIASDLHKALRESCDCYFYEAARRVGMEKIAAMATKLGLGQTYDAGIAQQKAGLIPSPQWKRFRSRTGWLIGETVLSGIGQGYVLTTPLQLAVMTARIASGRVVVPTLVKRDAEPAFAALDIDAGSLSAIRRGMTAVVNEPGGTGQSADLDDGKTLVAGKTGTSQVSRFSADRERTVALEVNQRDHAVFVAFAPADAPRYAVAVLLEHGGGGGAAAGPMVRDVLTMLFARDRRAQELVPAASAVTADPASRPAPVTPHEPQPRVRG